MAKAVDELQHGRDSFAKRAWADAFAAFAAADRAAPLAAADLELYGTAAYMVGRVDDFLAIFERAHHAHVETGELLAPARCAFYIGVNLAIRGETGRAGGWFARAQRLVERYGRECAERGYLLLPVAIQQQAAGDYGAAAAAAAEAARLGEQFGDADLFALAANQHGHVLIKQGRIDEALGLLDEAMVSATAGELSPVITGVVYCGVIAGCEEAYELRRAHEWTDALAEWCAEQPELVAFTGRCLAHRAAIMQLHGAWSDALLEAQRARERSERGMNRAAAGEAYYQQGDLQRLRGEFADAAAAYRNANRHGREPQPGLALLRLAQGDAEAAAAAIRRAIAETREPLRRARLLPALAEIMLAIGEVGAARGAVDELTEIAETLDAAMLHALAAHVRGSVDLAEGDATAALASLRRASYAWHELETPYEAARSRVLIGLACRALGDADTAVLELETARSLFDELGAAPDVARVDSLLAPAGDGRTHGLTARELEVLRLVAAGKTNREIASTLVLSEHTVARHVQNIFAKLRVSSRTAATAYAFEHELV